MHFLKEFVCFMMHKNNMSTTKVFNINGKKYIITDVVDPKNDIKFKSIHLIDEVAVINGKYNDSDFVDHERMIPIKIIKDIINKNEYAHHSTIMNQNLILSEIAALVGVDDESKLYDKFYLDDAEKAHCIPCSDLKTLTLFEIQDGVIRSKSHGPRFKRWKSSNHVEDLVTAGKTVELNNYLGEKYFSPSAIEKALTYENYNCLKALKSSVHWTECVNSFIYNCPSVLAHLNIVERYLVLINFVADVEHLFGGYYNACFCDVNKDHLCKICENRKLNYEYLFANGYIKIDSWMKAVDQSFKFAIRQIIRHRKYFKEDLSEHALQKNNSYALEKLREVGYPIKGEEFSKKTQINDLLDPLKPRL